jgi:anti-anti-sigma factor
MRQVEDIFVFNPSGDLDRSGGELLSRIREGLASERIKIVLDLRDVEHIHFRFLSELLGLAAVSSVLDGGIKLANTTPYHRQIMRFTGVDDCLETYDSVADAIMSFQDSFAEPRVLQ